MLIADKQEIELGTIKFGKTYSFKYTATNNGSSNLTIDKIVLGCGSCTKASSEKTTLLAGESTFVNVQFTPGSTGISKKSITILYSAGQVKRANLHLTFKATVNE